MKSFIEKDDRIVFLMLTPDGSWRSHQWDAAQKFSDLRARSPTKTKRSNFWSSRARNLLAIHGQSHSAPAQGGKAVGDRARAPQKTD